MVEVRRDGNELLLKQQRFAFSPVTSEKTWAIPIDITLYLKTGETQDISTLLNERTASVSIPKDTVALKLNSGQTGFYRVKYEQEVLDGLGQLIKQKKLPSTDSFGVGNDLFALVRRGDYSVTDYASFIESYFGQEDRYLPLLDISRNLMTLYLVVESKREQISSVGRRAFERALEAIGFEPEEDDSLQVSSIRDILLWAAFTFGSNKVAEFGSAKFQELLDGETVHADILPSVLKIGAVTNDHALDYLIERVVSADTAEAEKLPILGALGCLKDKEELLTALGVNLTKVPKNNRAFMINAVAQNPAATSLLWQWFLENFEDLEQLQLSELSRIIVNLIPVCGVGKETQAKTFLADFVKKHESAQDTIKMALELLEIYSKLGNAEQSSLMSSML
jgi:tricorn protease interacting factor F2/3